MNSFRGGVISRKDAIELNRSLERLQQLERPNALQTGTLSAIDLNGVRTTVDGKPLRWFAIIEDGPDGYGHYTASEIQFNADESVTVLIGGMHWQPGTSLLLTLDETELRAGDVVEVQYVTMAEDGQSVYVAVWLGQPNGSGSGSGSGDVEVVSYIADICVEYTELKLGGGGGSGSIELVGGDGIGVDGEDGVTTISILDGGAFKPGDIIDEGVWG